MTTRSGVRYCRTERAIMGDEEPTIAQLMKSLIDDRKLREQELAEERSQWKREQELKEECRRYEEALAQRDADMKLQMELLRGLVEGIKTRGDIPTHTMVLSNPIATFYKKIYKMFNLTLNS